MIIASTNGVLIIVERAMWSPQPSWYEAHGSPGATSTAPHWALAEGEVGGSMGWETYILIANTSAFGGGVRVTLIYEDGDQAVRTFTVPANSRTNVQVRDAFPSSVGRRFGAIVQSVDTTMQLVVERATYASVDGVLWASGTNALATRLP